ncbi:MAG: rhomboid family intramembrane serine protease [Prolixibacteraceae bacterium]|jgi:membrane associated rhomboid family serine protease|nr:rhomboid family intramembrane serine protease [Prolixibacteraceae bacterium]
MDIWGEIKQTFKQGSTITRLIYVNLAVFLTLRIVLVVFTLFKLDVPLLEWLALPSDLATLASRPWTLITYMFLHYNFIHILFNMLWLYWFGKIFMMYFDERKLLGTYVLGGLSGGVLYIIAYNVLPAFSDIAEGGILLGASASIIAIVISSAIHAPNLTVNLFLLSSIFGPIKIIWIAAASLLIYFIGITGTNAGGNIAQLGGALWGFIYISQLKKGKDITAKFNDFLFNFDAFFKRKGKMKVTYRRENVQRMSDREYNKRKRSDKENINVILDKIAKSGYDSLSKSEKEVLFKMNNKNGKPN